MLRERVVKQHLTLNGGDTHSTWCNIEHRTQETKLNVLLCLRMSVGLLCPYQAARQPGSDFTTARKKHTIFFYLYVQRGRAVEAIKL